MATAVPAATSTTPGTHSADSLIRSVLNYTSSISDPELNATALESLNSAIARINTRKWNKIYTTVTITLAADDADYGVPANFKEPMALLTENSSSERVSRLGYKAAKSMWLEHPEATVSGTPYYYTINYGARLLVLDVPPSSAYIVTVPTLEMWYYRRIAELTQGSSEIPIEPDFDWYIIWQARADFASIVDPQKYGLADRNASQRWRELIRNDTDQMTDWGDG